MFSIPTYVYLRFYVHFQQLRVVPHYDIICAILSIERMKCFSWKCMAICCSMFPLLLRTERDVSPGYCQTAGLHLRHWCAQTGDRGVCLRGEQHITHGSHGYTRTQRSSPGTPRLMFNQTIVLSWSGSAPSPAPKRVLHFPSILISLPLSLLLSTDHDWEASDEFPWDRRWDFGCFGGWR